MIRMMKKRSGLIKVSLHAAVLEQTYDALHAAAKRNNISVGEYVDSLINKAGGV